MYPDETLSVSTDISENQFPEPYKLGKPIMVEAVYRIECSVFAHG